MTITQVGKYLPDGIRALSNLLNMLLEAAAACKVTANPSRDWNYSGIKLDGSRYWIGVRFTDPENLWFMTLRPIDPIAASRLGVGEITEESWGQGWWRGIQLDSEEVHFFSRSKVSQMEYLESYLKECLAMARSIEKPEQPPIPEESEES